MVTEVVVIPAHNEGKTIAGVIAKTKQYLPRVIVVDDGSGDNTSSEAKKNGAMVLRHKINLGKGAALKTGCDYAVQQGAHKIIVMDADGQHDPKEIPKFINALQHNDIIFGCRKMPKTMPLVLRFGNTFISKTLYLLYKIEVEDSQCGYRAFTAEGYKKIRWEALDYYVETEMAIRAGRKRLKHAMMPIETIYADRYKGTTVLDGVFIVGKMIGWKVWH